MWEGESVVGGGGQPLSARPPISMHVVVHGLCVTDTVSRRGVRQSWVPRHARGERLHSIRWIERKIYAPRAWTKIPSALKEDFCWPARRTETCPKENTFFVRPSIHPFHPISTAREKIQTQKHTYNWTDIHSIRRKTDTQIVRIVTTIYIYIITPFFLHWCIVRRYCFVPLSWAIKFPYFEKETGKKKSIPELTLILFPTYPHRLRFGLVVWRYL